MKLEKRTVFGWPATAAFWRWLVARPAPIQLPPRILTFVLVAGVAAFPVAVRAMPPGPTLSVLNIAISVLIAVLGALFLSPWVRRRNTRRRP